MLQRVSAKIKNDIYFSTCFTLLFTAYNTQSHIQKTLTVSIRKDNPDYTVDGYVCFGIVYTFLSLSMWLSPAILVVLGRKLALVLGALCYTSFVSFCYFENVWVTYTGSAITGFGAALLWTGQASYIVLNSEVGSVYQGISLFWMLYECSYLFGNAFVYFQFHDVGAPIDRPMRLRITLILLSFVLLSVIMLHHLRPPIRHEEDENKICNPLNEIKKAFTILVSRTCLVLCVLFFYVGIHLTFMSVLGASMGFSKYLSSNSREYAPLSGFFQGIGEIAGCALALSIKDKQVYSLRLIFVCGSVTNIVAYVIDFLSLPESSSFNYTDQLPIVSLPIIFPIISNILIGIGDSCVHIEIYQCLGALYPNDSAPAFAVFKFVRCLAAALSFYYSNLFGLYTQIIILLVLALLGLISYHYVVINSKKTEEVANNVPTISYGSNSMVNER